MDPRAAGERSFARRDPPPLPRGSAEDEGAHQASRRRPRARILEHAARAFVAHGFDGVHMADIAEAAAIGKAKIYEYFPSKTALFVDCLDQLRYAVFGKHDREALGDATYEDESRLRACAVLMRFGSYRMMTNLLAQAAYGADAAVAERARAAFHRMVTNAEPTFARAMERGRLRTMDTELLAYMAWGALIAVGDRLAKDDRYTLDEALEAYLDFMQCGAAR